MRDRLRGFLLFLWKPVGVLTRHVSVRLIVDWLMTWVGVVVMCAVGLTSAVVHIVQLWNPTLPDLPEPARQPLSSVMGAYIEDVADLPDGRLVWRYNAPRRDPTGGPNYAVVQFSVSYPDDGSVRTPLPPTRWTLEGCGTRVVTAGTTSLELEILFPFAAPDACRVRLRYGFTDYGPWSTR